MSSRSIGSITKSLGRLSRRWLDRREPFRKTAVHHLTRRSGFSRGMSEELLDATFQELTEPKLLLLLRAELGDPRVLDRFCLEKRAGRWVRAHGPESILHIFSSNIPNVAAWSLVLGMLLKSRNIGKLSRQDGGFLELYLESLKKIDRPLYKTNVLLNPNDKRALSASLRSVSVVTAYGTDESLKQLQTQVPAGTPFFGYGHRMSLGLVMREGLDAPSAASLARKSAFDVWSVDQRGCLSPLVFYVQKGGQVSPVQWAALLARALDRLHAKDARKPRRDALETLEALGALKGLDQLGKIRGERTSIWRSRPPGLWTVRYEEGSNFVTGGAPQTVFVKGFDRLEKVTAALRPVKEYLQCVALECRPSEKRGLAGELSRLGVNRICAPGKMQRPPLLWHHDGRPNLASWVRWTDLECVKMSR